MEYIFKLLSDGSAELKEAKGDDAVISIPEEWEGHPVTSIGDYAIYQHKELTRVHLPVGIKRLGNHAFAENRFLTQIELPEGLTFIDDYCFYNCIRLERAVFPKSIKNMGFGAFRNDKKLKDIHLYTVHGEEIQINVILSDSEHELTVTFHYEDGEEAELVFTEFYYEETANIEARQFNHKTYGTGSLYRNCISSAGFNYNEYDNLYKTTVLKDEPETVIDMGFKRLRHPHQLSPQAKKFYVEYLKSVGMPVIKYLTEYESWQMFSYLDDGEPMDKAVLDEAIQYVRSAGKLEFVSLLMQYKNKYYAAVSKSFDL